MSDESWRGRVGRLDEAEISTFLAEAHLARLTCLDDEGHECPALRPTLPGPPGEREAPVCRTPCYHLA